MSKAIQSLFQLHTLTSHPLPKKDLEPFSLSVLKERTTPLTSMSKAIQSLFQLHTCREYLASHPLPKKDLEPFSSLSERKNNTYIEQLPPIL
ncbi:hypothetical protein CEXT_216751 [Caerostris extrusa]|uniref:Uncharacterized protein n=1 Tax=Caerostris extrusa TaxID=172846 RepID=A0AAV4Q8Q8_CAEEX|nr:hypothetical protein CEXT_216751 [Caerostris extrusa]